MQHLYVSDSISVGCLCEGGVSLSVSDSFECGTTPEIGNVVYAYDSVSLFSGDVFVERSSVVFVSDVLEISPNGRVVVEEVGSLGVDCVLRGSASFGVIIDCVLGSLGDLRLPASAIEGFEYQDVITSGFVPDVYAVRYLSQESGLSRPRTVDALVALRNLLEMCKGLDVGTVHAFCLKFRLVRDRRGHKFWVIEFT